MIYPDILTRFTSRQDAIMNHESCCLFPDQNPACIRCSEAISNHWYLSTRLNEGTLDGS
jgi:hypothetical protein